MSGSGPEIRVLDPDVAARIAAGEVVDRPAAALKELLENALDAGARRVEVRFAEGGIASLAVTDDGGGIPASSLHLALTRHATSKIRRAEDLYALRSYGFRGEALAAIAAAAGRLEVASRPGNDADGCRIVVADGAIGEPEPCAMAPGTRVVVEDLFGRLPARRAFLRSARGETAAIHDMVLRMALAAPDVAFRLAGERGDVFVSYGTGKVDDVLAQAYGEGLRSGLLPVTYETGSVRIDGYLADPAFARPTRGGGTLAVQGRVVESRSLAHAVESAYQGRLPRGRFPVYALSIRLDPAQVDVNVHPQKREVRFSDERRVYGALHHASSLAFAGRKVGFARPEGLGTSPGLDGEADGLAAGPDTPRQEAEERVGRSNWPFGEGLAVEGRSGPGTAGEAEEDVSEDDPGAWLPGRTHRTREVRISSGTDRLWSLSSTERIGPDRPESSLPPADPLQSTLLDPTGPGATVPFGAPRSKRLAALRQVRLLYIVAESDDGLRLVDQHAASERIRYEDLLAALKTGHAQVRQRLITPLVLSVQSGLEEICEAHEEDLLRWGFEARPFGTGAVRVWAVPPGLSLAGRALEALLQTFATGADGHHERAALVACHTAVRAGDPLSLTEMQRLLDDLSLCEAPATCPHGRPTVRGWTWPEIDRLFARRA